MDEMTGPAPLDILEDAWKEREAILTTNLSGIERKLNRPNLSDHDRRGYNFQKKKVLCALESHHERWQFAGLI
jgi:hypothetical protein